MSQYGSDEELDASHSVHAVPWTRPWPPEGLETLGRCPVCAAIPRKLLHRDAVDNVLFCAPGTWTYWSCSGCGCAYVDPRPTAATIHLAYENYHTHAEPRTLPARWPLERLKLSLKNGYRNWRFGTDLRPSTPLGIVLALCAPSMRRGIDREFRHLPRQPGGGRLLDVGFGAGAFLETARSAGWRVAGIDPDPEVVSNARRRGLDVWCTSIDEFRDGEGTYDVITVAHVIEHVHDPASLLVHCRRLLKPGGIVWLETPNVDSLGHGRFGRNWRGLEPPRHLAVFNRKALRALLQQAGFATIHDLPQASSCLGMFVTSDRMQRGRSPDDEEPVSLRLRVDVAIAQVLETCLGPSRKEFLALVARKPI